MMKKVDVLKSTPLQDFNYFSIMFYYVISTTYQKIGDLFCPVHISGLSQCSNKDDIIKIVFKNSFFRCCISLSYPSVAEFSNIRNSTVPFMLITQNLKCIKATKYRDAAVRFSNTNGKAVMWLA